MATKKKNRLPKLLAAGIVLVLILAAVLPRCWRDITFGWTERSDAERTVKA